MPGRFTESDRRRAQVELTKPDEQDAAILASVESLFPENN